MINRAGNECELNKGDHGWIVCKCFVNFGDAQEVTPAEEVKIAALINAKQITPHPQMNVTILQKIAVAAKSSKAIKIGLKKYFA